MMNLFPSPSPLMFRKSSYSERSNCVEVAEFTGGAAVRDSQHPDTAVLPVPAVEWSAFLSAARSGDL